MANIVITGANRGIGLALARRFAADGDTVLGLCRSPDDADALRGISGVTVGEIDIADQASVDAAVKLAPDTVDVLINNAGILGGDDQSLDGVDMAEWMRCFDVMALGPFRVTRAFVPKLAAAKGKVICTSSQLAATTWPYGGYYAYSSAKAAGNRVVHSLALDLKDQGITVVSLHPGYVQTDMGGPNAEITPEESAEGIHRLAQTLTPEQSGGFFKWNGEPHPL